MITLATILLFISALFLIILVLIQPDRSSGMTGSMGSGASNAVFGISKDGGPLAKATTVMAVVYMAVSIILYIIK